MKRLCLSIGLMVLCLSALARASNPGVRVLRVPGNGIYPQAKVDATGRLHLIYFSGNAGQGDIFYVYSDDGGKIFSRPVQVNSQRGSAIAVGTVRGPSLALGRGGRIHVAWNGSASVATKMGAKQVPMWYSRSDAAGTAFEPQRDVIQQKPGIDGGGSVAADDAGNVYIAWHAPDESNGEQDRCVWLTQSSDDGQTFLPEKKISLRPLGACGCCALKLAVTSAGQLLVLYRSADRQVHRDMYLLRSSDGGKTFDELLTDPWEGSVCTMSTADIASSTKQTVAAWETPDQVRFARLTDAGKIEIESAPGEGKARKHPAVATNAAGQFVITWSEGTGWNKGGAMVWQLFNADGSLVAGQTGRGKGLPVWSVPAVAANKDGSFVVLY